MQKVVGLTREHYPLFVQHTEIGKYFSTNNIEKQNWGQLIRQ